MSTATKAATMDPNSLTTVAGVGGLSSVAIAIAIKLYGVFYSARTDAAASQATKNIISDLQEENRSLREDNNLLRADNSLLTHEKYDFKAKLDSAIEKMEWMTLQMQDMKIEMTSLRETIKGMRSEHRAE